MKKIYLTFTILILSILSSLSQTVNNLENIPYIEVTGSSEMQVTPDELYFKILVKEFDKDKSGKIKMSEVEKLLIAKLIEIGIDTKDLKISDLSSFYTKKFLQASEVYSTKEYILKITDFTKVDTLYSIKDEKYIKNIILLYTDNSQITELRKQVKIDAIIAAKKKAEYLTNAIGDSIGKTLMIIELEPVINYYYGNYSNSNSFGNYSNDVSAYDLDEIITKFEAIELKYEIKVRFEIK